MNLSTETLIGRIPDFERRKAKYPLVSTALDRAFGHPTWRKSMPALDELVDCILSQSTNDRNRDVAFSGLKNRFDSWEAVMVAPTDEVVDAIRPAGLANQKAPRIQKVLQTIHAERGELNINFLEAMPIEDAKVWLTALDGVGPKTAAIVMCFGFNREAFPVDTHVHRVGQRIGFLPIPITAEKAHVVMEAIVAPTDYYPFHLNLIRLGREICTARRPFCERCPLTDYCDYYQQVRAPQDAASTT